MYIPSAPYHCTFCCPLAEGKIWPDGNLCCSYHGWRFDGSGACKAIPQADSAEQEARAAASPRACAVAYPIQERQGLLFVWGEGGAAAVEEAKQQEPPLCMLTEDAKAQGELEEADMARFCCAVVVAGVIGGLACSMLGAMGRPLSTVKLLARRSRHFMHGPSLELTSTDVCSWCTWHAVVVLAAVAVLVRGAVPRGYFLPMRGLEVGPSAAGKEVTEVVSYYTSDVPYDYTALVENVVDPYHVPWSHHGVQGDR